MRRNDVRKELRIKPIDVIAVKTHALGTAGRIGGNPLPCSIRLTALESTLGRPVEIAIVDRNVKDRILALLNDQSGLTGRFLVPKHLALTAPERMARTNE